MISSYNDIINYDGNDFEDYLNMICLIDIFKDLINLFKDKKNELKQAIKYILWTYSKQSDYVILGDDWLVNKKRIFDKTFLPKEYYEDLVLLKNRIVIDTIQRWVDFQDDEVSATLFSLRDLMIEMRLSSNSNIKNAQDEINYDQKYKNANYSIELKQKIKDLESELIQNDMRLKEGVKEIKRATKSSHSIGVEKYAV